MKIILLFTIFLSACASAPKCQTQGSHGAVYTSAKSCDVRIRQVEVGSKSQIPESLRDADKYIQELDWVDPSYDSGQIRSGHFVVTPKRVGETNGR